MKISDIKLELNKIKTLADLAASPHHLDERKGVQGALKSRARTLQKEAELVQKYDDMMRYENLHKNKIIAGIDEAGRGPLAGEVVASAVILPSDQVFIGLDDSKKIPAKKRQELREMIMGYADYGIGIASVEEIDRLNIYEATKLAMTRAVENLKVQPEHLLIDAMTLDNGIEQTSLIKGDALSNSIAAASIIAKTTRDEMMANHAKMYPQYDFEKNMGYGTKAHLDGLREYGACEIHRRSFEPIKSSF